MIGPVLRFRFEFTVKNALTLCFTIQSDFINFFSFGGAGESIDPFNTLDAGPSIFVAFAALRLGSVTVLCLLVF